MHIRLWGIPSEKIGQNIHPLESRFFVINYQHWTSTSAFWPILAPLDHWGGLWGPGGVWGACRTRKLHNRSETNLGPGMLCFGL